MTTWQATQNVAVSLISSTFNVLSRLELILADKAMEHYGVLRDFDGIREALEKRHMEKMENLLKAVQTAMYVTIRSLIPRSDLVQELFCQSI